jgi:transcriptional regulator with XRE-family HTH domain
MTQKKTKAGRPKKYDPKIMPQLAKWMRRSGLTDEQIADELKIARSTVYAWQLKYSEFSDALKEDKGFVDSLVEDSLLKRALGYTYEETKHIGEPDDKGGIKTIRVEKTAKIVIPDTTAQIFWLKNRQPAVWRDTKNIQANLAIHEIEKIVFEGVEGLDPELIDQTAPQNRRTIPGPGGV